MKKKGKKKVTTLVCAAVASLFGASLVFAGNPSASKQQSMDTKPGPAYRTIDGKLHKIEGDIFVVEDYNGNEVRLYVGKDTKKLRGQKKVGDTIRAEMTRGGFANSIQ